ncbi:MAG: hypothetical protein LBL93_02940 [Ruminococcus sp.]|jgi:hypothetical protein|nr:hypothetical protein [Ruminococcus sp.]
MSDIGQANFKRALKAEWDRISKGVKKPDLPKQRVFITITDKFGYDFIFLGISDGLGGAFNEAAEAAAKSKYKYNPQDKIKINYVLLEEETTLGRFAHSGDVVDGLVFGDNYEVCIVSSQFSNFPLLLEDGSVNETCLFPLIKKTNPHFDVDKIDENTEITLFQLFGSSNAGVLSDKAKNKLDILYKRITEKEKEYINNPDNKEKQVVFISICDGRDSANVFHGKGKDFKDAYEIAAEKTLQFVESNLYDLIWLKVDFVKEQTIKPYKEFLAGISKYKYGNAGAFCLIEGVSFDTNFRYPLLSMELNACRVWDFKEKKFNEEKLKYVFATKGIDFDKNINTGITNVITFKTQGYIIEENNEISYLMYNNENYGRRKNRWTKNDYMAAIKSSMEFILNTQKPDGSFYYGFMPSGDFTLTSYNSLRHCGTVLALVQYCELFGIKDKSVQNAIESALEWIVKAMVKYDENTFFITDTIAEEIKLGGGAIATLAFEAYDDFFGTDKYVPQITGLANGIVSLQEENGSFYHVLNMYDFSRKERNRIVYYDGESVFALAKAYTVTKNEVYLKAAEKTIHRFIETHYEKYCDHWVAYGVNEVTKYVHNKEFFEFGLFNASSNLKKVYNRKTAFHTYMEMIMAAYGTYKRMIELGMDIPESFDEEFFKKTILKRADYMLNSFFFPEMAMYVKKPMKYLGTFSVRHWDWRIRIDDLQHFIGGYYQFVKNYEDLCDVD